MRQPRTRTSLLARAAVPLALLVAAGMVWAQAPPQLDKAAAEKGAIVYARYCVSCHGKAARGNGSLSADLRVPVPDITKLSARNGGRFPEQRVQRIVENGEQLRGHGTPDMPAWGDAFKRTAGIDAATPEEAVRNVTHYIWSLQRAAGK
jgi:mono/diheme cytochrome c family protein